MSITVPAWWSGQLWGRHGCSFDRIGKGSCATGDCGSGLFCNSVGGAPPATLAEFTLGAQDFYDVSLVDGYNLPLAIASRGGTCKCTYAGCISDLNASCPPALQDAEQIKITLERYLLLAGFVIGDRIDVEVSGLGSLWWLKAQKPAWATGSSFILKKKITEKPAIVAKSNVLFFAVFGCFPVSIGCPDIKHICHFSLSMQYF